MKGARCSPRFHSVREDSSKMEGLIFLSFIGTFTSLTGAQYIKQQNSLRGPFESATMEDWFIAGNTELTPNVIQLTKDEPYNGGSVWNIPPCKSPDWEIQIQFLINGKEHSYGNGIGIWYVKDPLQIGPVFGSKDFFSGLGVFIDTFQNPSKPHKHSHPYISAMVNNGSLSYAHDADGTFFEIGSCHADLRNKQHITRIAVSYIEDTLTLYLDVEGLSRWIPCFRTPGVYLPTGYHFGVSASTSDATDIHGVVSITALEFNIPRPNDEPRDLIIPHAEIFKAPTVADAGIKQEIPDQVQETKQEEAKPIKTEKVKVIKEQKVEPKKEKTQETKKKKENIKRDVPDEAKPKVDKKAERKIKDHVSKEKIEQEDIKTSLITKSIYVIGSVIIIAIAVSTCRKYLSRRKEMMEKRLY